MPRLDADLRSYDVRTIDPTCAEVVGADGLGLGLVWKEGSCWFNGYDDAAYPTRAAAVEGLVGCAVDDCGLAVAYDLPAD